MFKNIIIKSLKNCEKVYETRTVLYQCIQTLIKHVFAFNFPHELLMSLISNVYNMTTQKPRHVIS